MKKDIKRSRIGIDEINDQTSMGTLRNGCVNHLDIIEFPLFVDYKK